MYKLINRQIAAFVNEHLSTFPAVAILGPRQCGKSTLVEMMYQDSDNFLYLDLQNSDDRHKLTDPALFFQSNREATICLDDVQLLPELIPVLREEIDRDRRPGRFILLGPTSRKSLQNTSGLLGERVGVIELAPFSIREIEEDAEFDLKHFWLRGGYPGSYLAPSNNGSVVWREKYLRAFTDREFPRLGIRAPAPQLRRLLTICAQNQGHLLNSARIGDALGMSYQTVRRCIDLMEQAFVIRALPSFGKETRKQLVKSSRIYVRDSGLVHRLLQLDDFQSLQSNPIFGPSWEGFAIENIISSLRDCAFSFYRNVTGDEVDLLIEKGSRMIAVECKASLAPQVTRGFWNAINDAKADEAYIVAPVNRPYLFKHDVMVYGLAEFLKKIEAS
jgi:predicted AAA+ superfamily ATPase